MHGSAGVSWRLLVSLGAGLAVAIATLPRVQYLGPGSMYLILAIVAFMVGSDEHKPAAWIYAIALAIPIALLGYRDLQERRTQGFGAAGQRLYSVTFVVFLVMFYLALVSLSYAGAWARQRFRRSRKDEFTGET